MLQQLRQHLRKLCVDIGPRPNGSPGNYAAADYIQSIFHDCKLETETQHFGCPDWQEHETTLWLDDLHLTAVANPFSPSCMVSAQTVAAGTLAQLETAAITGRIVVLYGDLTCAPLLLKSRFPKKEREDRIIKVLEAGKPAAILTVQTRPGKLERLIEDAEFKIPSATVPAKAGLKLLQQIGANVDLRIVSETVPGSTANVIGRLPGEKPEQIVLCAHYDTKFGTPGASDNATGVATLLALAQQLSEQKHLYSFEFVAFTGEETMPTGDDEYVRLRGKSFNRILAALNFDGVGQLLSANSITSFNCSQPFQQQLHEITCAYPGVVWVDPWTQSNHSTFAMRDVPTLAFTRRGGVANEHLRSDKIDWVSAERLEEVVQLALAITDRIEAQPPDWTREHLS